MGDRMEKYSFYFGNSRIERKRLEKAREYMIRFCQHDSGLSEVPFCQSLKSHIQHVKQCMYGNDGICYTCPKYTGLCFYHAQDCTNSDCDLLASTKMKQKFLLPQGGKEQDTEMMMFVHIYQCKDANCNLPSCRKLKNVMQHVNFCDLGFDGSCTPCQLFMDLCFHHAYYCTNAKCVLPICPQVKEKIKQEQQTEPTARTPWHYYQLEPRFGVNNVSICERIMRGMQHFSQCKRYELCVFCTEFLNMVLYDSKCCKDPNCEAEICVSVKEKVLEKDGVLVPTPLKHVYECEEDNCELIGCFRMKKAIEHAGACTLGMDGKCIICYEYMDLCIGHAKECKDVTCVLGNCSNAKLRLEQELQQGREDKQMSP